MRIKKAGIALAAATALVLSACSSSDDTATDGAATGGAEGEAQLALSDYNKVDPAELTQGGNFRLAIGSMPTNYNPMQVDGNTVDNNGIWGYMSPINWIFDETGAWEPNPNFVESYEVNDAPEGDAAMVVTLNLNPEAAWYDGTPITVADYAATWDACNDPEDAYSCASTDGWTAIDSVEQGENEFQVVVSYNIPYPDWSANLSGVYPAAGVSDPETFNTGWVEPNVETLNNYVAGPFKFDSIDTATQRITLVPNEKWWGSEPKLATVTFSVLDTDATAQAFANNELDAVDMIVDAATYELVQTRPDVAIKMSGSQQWRHLTFNSRAESLADVEVRRAIQKGIDQMDFVATDLAGLPSADYDMRLGNHFFMPGQDGYQDNSIEFDPEGARADLEALGYTEGADGYYAKDGEVLGFDFLRIPGTPTSESAAALLTEHMKEIGVQVTVKDVPSEEFFNQVIAGEFEVTSFAWNGTPYPMANVGQIYGKPFNAEGALVNSNFAGLEVPEIDEYVAKIAAETDDVTRKELTNEVDQIIWDNVMVYPLYYRANITAVPENLANYGATNFETFLPENIGYTN